MLEVLSRCDNCIALANAEDGDGRSALDLAAQGGHVHTVKVPCFHSRVHPCVYAVAMHLLR